MRILVTGAGGMLGSAFSQVPQGHQIIRAGREMLQITDPRRLDEWIGRVAPEVLINCAADTDVEAAERDPERAMAANAFLPGRLAAACRHSGALLVHFSSTGCYGAWKDDPFTEEDEVRPTTAYHRSKVFGEAAVREAGCEFLVIRTGWLFGGSPGHAKNFVWKRLLEARSVDRLVSDASQVGNPTHADDVVRQTMAMLDRGLRGTFNCVSRGRASRFDYVRRIVQTAGLPCLVEAATVPFSRLAKVSPNESGSNRKLRVLGAEFMPEWRESLDDYVSKLITTPEWGALNVDV